MIYLWYKLSITPIIESQSSGNFEQRKLKEVSVFCIPMKSPHFTLHITQPCSTRWCQVAYVIWGLSLRVYPHRASSVGVRLGPLECIVKLPWCLKISPPPLPHFQASKCISMGSKLTLPLPLPLDTRCGHPLKFRICHIVPFAWKCTNLFWTGVKRDYVCLI